MIRVSVITRTKDRPLLLRRCAETLLRQEFAGIEWILVNDAGDTDPVEQAAEFARAGGLSTRVIHRPQSLGVWPAANHGLQEASGEFVHLHDDDDTVEPTFYRRMVEFLDERPHYGGVVAAMTRIDEVIRHGRMVMLRSRRLSEPDGALHLSDMFNGNLFAPIAFVYRRSAHERLGPYDETLPVLGDWEFNLRFMRYFDIGGINEALANWHFRSAGSATGTPQTVVAGKERHKEYTALIRNRLLRESLEAGAVSPGLLAAHGRNQRMNQDLLRVIDDRTTSMGLFRSALRRMFTTD